MTDDKYYPAPHRPMAVARQLKKNIFSHNETPIIRYWQDSWWRFNGRHWQETKAFTLRGPIYNELEGAVYYDDKRDVRNWNPGRDKVSQVLEPLAILTTLDDDTTAPCWLDESTDNHPSAENLIVLANGVYDMHTGDFIPGHDPDLFTTWSLDFGFDPAAECPTWLAFLDEVFAHDPNGLDALQEFAGYLVSGRLDLQKGMMIIGPRRAGKGIISRTLKHLVGCGNVVSPTLGTLGSRFGLQSFLGKTLAVVEDSRNDRDNTHTVAVERLLSIIGQDDVTVERKNRTDWLGRLQTRFLFVSNEVPRLNDSSGAIISRFITIELTKSFVGKEDPNLGAKIARELPGIFNWALGGLERLNRNGRFTTPATAADMEQALSDLGQPVTVFLDEVRGFAHTRNHEDFVLLKELHNQYKAWCQETGSGALKQSSFGQSLKALPDINVKNTWESGVKARRVYGVKKTSMSIAHGWSA